MADGSFRAVLSRFDARLCRNGCALLQPATAGIRCCCRDNRSRLPAPHPADGVAWRRSCHSHFRICTVRWQRLPSLSLLSQSSFGTPVVAQRGASFFLTGATKNMNKLLAPSLAPAAGTARTELRFFWLLRCACGVAVWVLFSVVFKE